MFRAITCILWNSIIIFKGFVLRRGISGRPCICYKFCKRWRGSRRACYFHLFSMFTRSSYTFASPEERWRSVGEVLGLSERDSNSCSQRSDSSLSLRRRIAVDRVWMLITSLLLRRTGTGTSKNTLPCRRESNRNWIRNSCKIRISALKVRGRRRE